MSEQPSTPHSDVTVDFCRNGCWKTTFPVDDAPRIKGEDVANQLATRNGLTTEELMSGDRVENIVEGCVLKFRKVPCLGACGKSPAARVRSAGRTSTYFRAESPEAVTEAILRHLAASMTPKPDETSG